MRFLRLLTLVPGTLLLMSGSASAQSTQPVPPARTAETLLEACSSDDQVFLMRCNAYLAGVADSMDFIEAFQKIHGSALYRSRLTMKPFGFCHNGPWSSEALRQSFISYANAHPNLMQEDQYVVAVDALHDSYPCGK